MFGRRLPGGPGANRIDRLDPESHNTSFFVRKGCAPQLYPRRTALLVFLLLMVWQYGISAAINSNIRFQRYGVSDGLPDHHVLSITQDSLGFMWFGLRTALVRFDGYRFHSYIHETLDSNSIGPGGVRSMIVDSEGTLWVATSASGVCRYNHVSDDFERFSHVPTDSFSLSGNNVHSICEGPDNTIWCVTKDGSAHLNRIDKRTGTIKRFYHDSNDVYSTVDGGFHSIASDREQNVWMLSNVNGLQRYVAEHDCFVNRNVNANYRLLDSILLGRIAIDHDNNILASGFGQAIILPIYDGKIGQRSLDNIQYFSLRNIPQRSVLRSRSGTLLVGSFRWGLMVFDTKTAANRHYMNDVCNPHSLSGNDVNCLFEDRNGYLWIGTDNGISRAHLDAQIFSNVSYSPSDSTSLSHNKIRSLFVHDDGEVWVGTAGRGLNYRKPGEQVFRQHIAPITDMYSSEINIINFIKASDDGNFWLGTNNGLYLYSRELLLRQQYRSDRKYLSVRKKMHVNQMFGWGIWSLDETADDLWVGVLHWGLNRLRKHDSTWQLYYYNESDPHSISNDNILCMHRDRRNRLWIGTDRGLNRYNPVDDNFSVFRSIGNDTTTISDDRVWVIREDEDGFLWLATAGGGINRFDPRSGKNRRFTEEHGLASNFTRAILQDNNGHWWISTMFGISHFDPEQERFINFAEPDGIGVKEFHLTTSWKDNSGRLYFGGLGGYVDFHPDSVVSDRGSRTMTITTFAIFDQAARLDTSIFLKREIELQHDENFFSLGFAALNFDSPQHIRYEYRLDNFSDVWRVTDGRHPVASFTNVAPGNYLFRVRELGGSSSQTKREARIGIRIIPAFWQTWWFRAMIAMLALALLTGAVITRLRTVQRQERTNRKLVEFRLQSLRAQMNPHFIFNSLNSIVNFITKNDAVAAHSYLNKFAKLMRSVLESSNCEAISLEEDIKALQYYIELEALRFRDKFSYHIDIDQSLALHKVLVPPLLIQPFVENAIKHGLAHRASKGRLRLSISGTNEQVLCLVEDNGIGRAKAAEVLANSRRHHISRGMHTSNERIAMLSSISDNDFDIKVIDLQDENGQPAGTRVEILIPIQ